MVLILFLFFQVYYVECYLKIKGLKCEYCCFVLIFFFNKGLFGRWGIYNGCKYYEECYIQYVGLRCSICFDVINVLRMVFLESGLVILINSFMKSVIRRKFMLKCELSIFSCSIVLEFDVMVNMYVNCCFIIFLMIKKCGLFVKQYIDVLNVNFFLV